MEQWYSITYHKADLYLGIKIECDDSGSYNISQQHYLEELLKELNMQNCKPNTTSISKREVNALTVRDTEGKKLDTNSHVLYCQIVGKLMYAMVGTRPDLAYTLSVLGRFAAAPDTYYMVLAKRTLTYVKIIINYQLYYNRGSGSAIPILTGYFALYEATTECVYLYNLMTDIGIPQKGPTTIRENNQITIKLTEDKTSHKRTKHITVKYHYSKEQ
jgi:hypothetical protein